MMAAKEQFCDYCGEALGVFAHSRRLDGPLCCGSRECGRDAREDERGDYDERAQRAQEDDYERY